LRGQALLENARRNQATDVAEEFSVDDAQKVAAAGEIKLNQVKGSLVILAASRARRDGYQ
jgi:hypothetical protein